jgi:hypothetical protein
MFELFKKRNKIVVKELSKGRIVTEVRGIKDADGMMRLVYAMCKRFAVAYGVDVRFFIKKILWFDTQVTKLEKQRNETRPYKKAKAGGKNAKPATEYKIK